MLKTLPLLCQKVYKSVGSFMLVILPSLIIHDWKALLGKTWSLEIQTLFIIFSDWQNNEIWCISFLKGTDNCFCSSRILRRNSYLNKVNLETAKIWLLKIKMNKYRWRHSTKQGSLGMSRIPNSFLTPFLAVILNDFI